MPTTKDIVNNWLTYHATFNNKNSIVLDNINWNCTANEIIKLGEIKTVGGTLNLKGKITLDVAVDALKDLLKEFKLFITKY